MPQLFRVGNYIVYFWSNEGDPIEPVHVHIAQNHPSANGSKVWITASGKALFCNNDAKIPLNDLRKLMRMIESNSEDIIQRWVEFFGESHYYC